MITITVNYNNDTIELKSYKLGKISYCNFKSSDLHKIESFLTELFNTLDGKEINFNKIDEDKGFVIGEW